MLGETEALIEAETEADAEIEALAETDADMLADTDAETEAEMLVLALILAEIEAETEADTEAEIEAEMLTDADNEAEILALTEADKLADTPLGLAEIEALILAEAEMLADMLAEAERLAEMLADALTEADKLFCELIFLFVQKNRLILLSIARFSVLSLFCVVDNDVVADFSFSFHAYQIGKLLSELFDLLFHGGIFHIIDIFFRCNALVCGNLDLRQDVAFCGKGKILIGHKISHLSYRRLRDQLILGFLQDLGQRLGKHLAYGFVFNAVLEVAEYDVSGNLALSESGELCILLEFSDSRFVGFTHGFLINRYLYTDLCVFFLFYFLLKLHTSPF